MRINTTAAVAFATLGLALGGLTACDDKDTESADDSAGQGQSDGGSDKSQDSDEQAPEGELSKVTIVKSGGFEASKETLELKADGSWSYVKNRMAPKEGELSEKEEKSLQKLAADDKLTEKGDTSSKKQCNDVQRYTLSLEFKDESKPVELKDGKCGETPNDAFKGMVDLVSEATPI